MNIRHLQEAIRGVDEIAVIGKSVKLVGVVSHVLGIVRKGSTIRLLVLQYDEAYKEQMEMAEMAALDESNETALESNRLSLRNHFENNPFSTFMSLRQINIGEKEFAVQGAEMRRLSIEDWENLFLLVEFLRHGWQPIGIDYQNVDSLLLNSLGLEGEYSTIPVFDPKSTIRLIFGPEHKSYLVEQPITLTVGGEYKDILQFQVKATGEEQWVQINRVYLCDMWSEMEKVFANPELQEQMTLGEITQAKADFEKRFLEVCPKGMYFPIVEYECEENISLQFYSKDYLDSQAANKNNSIGFFVRPDQDTGILGKKLKSSIIQEPVPANTKIIEAELFQINQTETSQDIVID